ncbi:hypothetical protein QBC44DRAFT_129984 [Cladorrhinum sp. PSN332]|nr:hypothetical protein QBC44DRAFT_129984 [Cladorrhinum sp. PSN332]
MPKPTSKIPDAWDDDDWEAQADKLTIEDSRPKEPIPEAPLSKQERIARHQEEMRKIWESAEAPPKPTFLPTTSNVPIALTTAMKPAVKLLSRKPALQDDDEDQESSTKKIETPEEIQERQQREYAEKRQRYEEARAKIFAESPNLSSGQSSPGSVTPPQHLNEGRQGSRGRGRGRGGGRGGGGRGDYNNGNSNNGRQQQQQQHQYGNRRQQATESPQTEQPTRQLYDPNYSPRGGGNTPRRNEGSSPQLGSRSHTPLREEDQPIRSPRGPDGSGRGGFGFARRGGGNGTAPDG